METDNTMKLRDDRTLGYAEYGDRSGIPVFYNHSGSRLDIRSASPLAESLGVRLIALDRPGIGLSDFWPGYQFLDWPDDVVEAADRLELDRFAMFGHSIGGAFTLACAYKMPERMTRCATVGGAAPMDAPGVKASLHPFVRAIFTLGKYTTWPMKIQSAAMSKLLYGGDNERISQNMMKAMSGPDKEAIAKQPELLDDVVDAARETFRSGTEGAVWANGLACKPWGFSLEDIRVPVAIFHGEKDTNAPPAMAEHLAQTIPDSQLVVFPNEGHGSLLFNHIEEILRYLAAPQEDDKRIEASEVVPS